MDHASAFRSCKAMHALSTIIPPDSSSGTNSTGLGSAMMSHASSPGRPPNPLCKGFRTTSQLDQLPGKALFQASQASFTWWSRLLLVNAFVQLDLIGLLGLTNCFHDLANSFVQALPRICAGMIMSCQYTNSLPDDSWRLGRGPHTDPMKDMSCCKVCASFLKDTPGEQGRERIVLIVHFN